MPRLVLASSSPYRRALLERLGLPFECVSPDVDETPQPGEPADALALRLSDAKARAVARRAADALVVGSDQVAVNGDRLLGKPGDRDGAVAQLRAASGRTVRFLTGCVLLDAASGRAETAVVPCAVTFRSLSPAEIARYVELEQPFDCAGGFKAEGLGVALFERIDGPDPTALTGLPLIALTGMLRRAGLSPLA